MNHKGAEFTKKKKNSDVNNSINKKLVFLVSSPFLCAFVFWVTPILNFGINHTLWNLQNILHYEAEILYLDVSGSFTSELDDVSIEDMFDRAFECAMRFLSICRVNYDYQYHYPKYIWMDAYPMYVNEFEPTTKDE